MDESEPIAGRTAPGRPSTRWLQILLLLPLPPLSFFFLHLVRAGHIVPSFVPVVVMALFPAASIFLASRRLGASPIAERPPSSEIALVAVAITELAWAAVSAAAVAMTLSARPG